jgi:hypothetical protein
MKEPLSNMGDSPGLLRMCLYLLVAAAILLFSGPFAILRNLRRWAEQMVIWLEERI